MEDLKKLRTKIDETDKKIADLFCQRMDTVKKIALYKKERGLKVFDENRENAVIEKNSAYVNDAVLKSYYVSFLKNTMEVSRKYQHRLLDGMKIALSGVEGAFAHIAGKKIFPDGKFEFYPDFESAYKSVESGDCDECVLPLENSFAGEVSKVTDLIYSGSLYINGVFDLEISHNLMGLKDAELTDIKTVISHPQALSQCEGYIRSHGFKEIKESNTAVSAFYVAKEKDKTLGAIASKETAELYNLKILDHDINESSRNTTRFAVFSRVENVINSKEEKFVMVFAVRNQTGALAKAINIIGKYGFNMRTLRSRPVKDEPWHYYFYVEAEGNTHTENAKNMLDELSLCCTKVKIAGSFLKEENI